MHNDHSCVTRPYETAAILGRKRYTGYARTRVIQTSERRVDRGGETKKSKNVRSKCASPNQSNRKYLLRTKKNVPNPPPSTTCIVTWFFLTFLIRTIIRRQTAVVFSDLRVMLSYDNLNRTLNRVIYSRALFQRRRRRVQPRPIKQDLFDVYDSRV